MFSLGVVDTDAFLEMPATSQNLYFHLGMRADDDGFVSNPKKILKTCGAGEDDLKVLFGKRFILGFQTGIIVIKHWRMHNYIRTDRYTETSFQDEMAMLEIKPNGSYTERKDYVIPDVIPDGNRLDTQVRLGKDSIDKDTEPPPKPHKKHTDTHPDYAATVALFYPPGCEYKPDAKQCKHIKDLLKLYPLVNIRKTIERLRVLKDSDAWWRQQPVVPSIVRQHWERINERGKGQKTVEELYG
jgi:hypothetical protein